MTRVETARRAVRAKALGTALATIFATGAMAQPASGAADAGDMAEIVVTGTPVRQQIFLAPADIDVLAGADKERAEHAGLGHTLDALPGVANISTGEQVGLPVIRGLSGNRIRVMMNDVGLYYQQYGTRHPVNIDPFLADRLEIVRGPASLQYGSDAIGGAINILSRPIPTAGDGAVAIHGAARLGLSTAFDSIDAGLRLEAAVGRFGVTAAWVHRDSGGMRTPDRPEYRRGGPLHLPLVTGRIPFTDYSQDNLAIAAGYHGDDVTLTLRHERYASDQNYLVPDPQPGGRLALPGGLGQRLQNQLWQAQADVSLAWGRIDTSLTLARNDRLANAGGADPQPLPVRPDPATDLRRDSLTLRSVLHHDRMLGLAGQIGIEYVAEDQWSRGPERLAPGGAIDSIGIFVFEEARIDRLTVNLGARYDRREQALRLDRTTNLADLPTGMAAAPRRYDQFTWGIGASYRLTEALVAAANIRTGYRAPDLFDLYTRGIHGGVAAIQIGDPDLTAEKAVTGDAALRWRSDHVRGRVTAYLTRFDGFIGLLGTGLDDVATSLPIFAIAQRDARVWGFDADLVIEPLPRVELHGTYERVRGTFTDDQSRLPFLPADTLIAEASYRVPATGGIRSAYATLGVRHAFAQRSAGIIEPFGNFDGGNPGYGTASTAAYTLVHVHGGVDFGLLSLRLEIDNLFDIAYRDFLDTYKTITLGPRRDVRASAIVRF